MNFSTFSDDCLLAVFSELPLSYRLRTVPLVCRRWTGLQPLVRRAVTSVKLLGGNILEADQNQLMSPFCLVDRRTLVTETPNLLQLPTSTDVVERLQTELPNIRRLSIVQVNLHLSALQPELLSAVEACAGQLTSFAFFCQYTGHFKLDFQPPEGQPPLSAGFHRLLSLINYKMPQLRHLQLSSNQSFFYNDTPCTLTVLIKRMNISSSSLYLPVLRRLHTFSFKSPYHADILHYSLVKFASGNNRLKLRLVYVPLTRFYEESQLEKLWKEEAVISHLDYLYAIYFSPDDRLKLCQLANIKHLHLQNYNPSYDSKSLLPLFTILSRSFPKLTTFSLNMQSTLKNFVPENLPPLPSVTSLVLNIQLDKTNNFEKIFQPTRVFPALRRLTIDSYPCSTLCSAYIERTRHKFDLSIIQQALKSLKLYPPGALQHISIIFCKRICQGKRLVLKVEDL